VACEDGEVRGNGAKHGVEERGSGNKAQNVGLQLSIQRAAIGRNTHKSCQYFTTTSLLLKSSMLHAFFGSHKDIS